MKRRGFLALSMALVLLGHTRSLQAQDKKTFKPEELDQMLAPIALYSDALLAQMLMAASYPLEIVEAARWAKSNPTLKGDAAVAAVKDKDWDVSVMSMVAFPDLLAQMSEQLTWTQKLGDAMLGQQQDVADSIQRLRAKASAAGNLQTTPQQTVTTQGSGDSVQYVITPTNPEVIYVPSYNPSSAYGAWPYPEYPPYHYPYGGVLATGLLWGLGIAAAGAMYGGWRWGGYGNSYANINVNRAVNIDRNFDRNRIDGDRWNHAEHHRKGVAYRDDATRQRFGQQARPGVADRDQFRGRLESGGRPGGPGGPGGPGRPGGLGGPGGPGRPGGAGQGLADRTPGTRPGSGAGGVQRPATRPDTRPSALSGSNRGPQINNQSNRGRQQMNRAQSHGGGGRAGGGGGRPGGGGGGGGGGRPGGGGGGGGRAGGGGGGGGRR